ncbi:MAG: DUF4445 domain-containing protein [Lachnospiraceae bacterium]|nr:DUF4445 domain-containing protein [Lachnospiraceae bacterium]
MSENISVNFQSGGCVDCSNCGLCGKSKKEASVVTDSVNAPQVSGSLAALNGLAGSGIQAGAAETADEIPTLVAVDLGTTTIGMYLINAVTGEQMGVFVSLNPQQIHGADVISRISNANAGKKEELQALITETIESGVKKLVKERTPKLIVISGNTVMGHLLMGYDVESLGVYPFKAEHLEQAETAICGIKTILMPGISAFIGGDVVSGLYTLGFKDSKEVSLLIDLGTNAEMVIGNCDRMLALSAAAGPAFDQKVYGSQLIKAVAQILTEEKADRTGCLAEEYFELGCIAGRTLVKQEEIRELQKAKAAVAAGITLLAREYGVQLSEIRKVYIAGGLGFYLDLDAAVEIGLFPKEFVGKMEAVGNTSLEGAYRYGLALEQDVKEPDHQTDGLDYAGQTKPERELKELLSKVRELNLAELEGFEETYINAMNF